MRCHLHNSDISRVRALSIKGDKEKVNTVEKQREHDVSAQGARNGMLSDKQVNKMCKVFQLLADPVRLKIVLALLVEDMCVGPLTELCGVTQSGVSHQLRILRDNEIVTAKRLGQRVEYSIADEHIREIIEMGKAHLLCADGRGA